jgi:Flp pilus assembly pilin Flp
MALSCHAPARWCYWPLKAHINTISSANTSVGLQLLARRARVSLGASPNCEEFTVAEFLSGFWADDSGQDVAEYAVMLAVILVIVVGTIRLIGSNANNVFSQVGSSLNQ